MFKRHSPIRNDLKAVPESSHSKGAGTTWLASALAFVLVSTASGCLYSFDRSEALQPGEIAGRAIRSDGSPIAFAKVAVIGSGKLGRAEDTGVFSVRDLRVGVWTLRVVEDADLDGVAERGAIISATLVESLHAGESSPRLTSISLGDVSLLGVSSLSGEVKLDGVPLDGAKVVIERLAGVAGVLANVGAEAQTTAVDGIFTLNDVVPGTVSIVAATVIDGATFISQPAIVELTSNSIDGLELNLLPAEGTRSVRVETSPGPGGSDVVQVRLFGVDTSETFTSLSFDAPVGGAWNVDVRNETQNFVGGLAGQLVPPGPDVLVWGPIGLVLESELCGVVAGRNDCDRDSFPGLPPLERDDQGFLTGEGLSVWQGCASTCVNLENQTCTVGGVEYDCDDDGDGQPDLTEPPECYGASRGTDLDGDGFCDPIDPHPGCDDRDVVLTCDEGGLPDVWFEYLVDDVEVDGGVVDAGIDAGVDGGVPDGGVPDGGVPDGGVPDGGVPDGGVPDGGVVDGGVPDGGVPDAGELDAGVPDAGPPPVPPAPSTGLRVLGTPGTAAGPNQLLEQQLIPAQQSCAGNRCVTGGLVP